MNLPRNALIAFFLFFAYSFWYFSHNTSQVLSGGGFFTWSGNILESQKIEEAYEYLEKYYYGFHEKSATDREDALIDALTKSLWDKHTSYFNPKSAQEFAESLSGDFEWIGAVIKEHPKGIQIMKVLSDSPAEKNGLIKWDIITSIDGIDPVGMLVEDAVDIIRGPQWSIVTLQILSGEESKEVKIKRDTVMVPSVDGHILTGTTIGYVEIGFFWEHTTDEFIKEIQILTSEGASWLIIDARNNGGGFLNSAVEILSVFVPEGNIAVMTRGIRPSENMDYKTLKQTIQNFDIPVVMIVNNMSASATEIVAWALQDYERAIIIGEKTYGKWSVQEPFILSDGSMMKITVAKWFTPKDRGIDEKWIDPDVKIELTDADYENIYDRQLEWAQVIIKNLIDTKKSPQDWKNNTDAIDSLLKESKISE